MTTRKDAERRRMVMELLHYVLLYTVLLVSWVQAMGFFNGSLIPTAVTVFIIFVAADQLLHVYLLEEKKPSWWRK